MDNHLTDIKPCQICGGTYPERDYWFHTRYFSLEICPACSRVACKIAELSGLEFAALNSKHIDDASRVPQENPFTGIH
jgi:hypothetical protein